MDQPILAAQEAEETYDCLSKLTNVRQPRYRLLALLGEGPTGRVFKAQNTYSNNIVAVKIIDTNDREWVSREGDALFAIKKEVRRVNTSAAYGSFGILEVLDVVPFLDTLWMASPLCEGGNLKTLMQPLGYLKPVYIETTLRDVARGLFWLHNQETFHGNVKAANVLVDDRGGLRLCDFDLVSRGEISPSHSDCAYNGSLHWLAPERLEDRHNFHKHQDIWSFGALAYELATGLPPLSSLESDSAILEHLASAGPPHLTGDQHCENLKKLIEYCLVVDIDQRPSMNLVFSHAYLSSTSELASLRDVVDTFHHWKNMHNTQEADAEDQSESHSEFALGSPLANPQPDDTNSDSASLAAESPGDQHGEPSPLHMRGDSDGEFSAWSLVDEPSRCSSPFDLQHLVTRTLSFDDLGSDGPNNRHDMAQTSITNNGEGSSRQSNASGIPITIGLSLPQDEAVSPAFSSDFRSNTRNDELNVDLDMDFNPNFDVFTSEIATSSATYETLADTHEITTQMPYDPVTDVWSSPHPGTLLYPRPYLWDSPPVSPSSSPVRTPAGRPLAFVPGPGLLLGGVLPAPTYVQGTEHQALWTGGQDFSAGGDDDDDDCSTVRLRDSNPVNLEMAATAAPSTPPTTPDQPTQFKGKEPVSSPHAWPPFRLASRSTNDVSSQTFSPPLTPSLTKPLPPLPKTIHMPATAASHRPSTSGGGSSSGRSALHNAPPPVPMIPMPLRRPSVDIFSPVSYDSFGSSFDAQGNYIPHPAPLSPSQRFEFEPKTNITPQRHKEKSPAILRERMIPREAGSCPPRRRKSHPAIGSRDIASSSSSHSPKTSSSSSSSSSSRPTAKFPPRNASFSVFPSSRPSTAAAAQAAINARNNLLTSDNSSRDSIASRMPPRRPSEPIPTNQHSFFDYDADEESDLEDFEFPRKNSAAEIKKGVKRLVSSVSANLGDTIRGLETAPRKGLRWMKRSSPSM